MSELFESVTRNQILLKNVLSIRKIFLYRKKPGSLQRRFVLNNPKITLMGLFERLLNVSYPKGFTFAILLPVTSIYAFENAFQSTFFYPSYFIAKQPAGQLKKKHLSNKSLRRFLLALLVSCACF